MLSPDLPAVVILGGGRASRLGGGDKGLRRLGAKTILSCIIERMCGQGCAMVLNANGDAARFAAFDLPVIEDSLIDAGPLAGVLAGMEWALSSLPTVTHIVTVPTDTPFLPRDLVARLTEARKVENAELAWAVSRDRQHPVVALWPVALAAELRCALIDEKLRKVETWMRRYRIAEAVFETGPVDPFFNINTETDRVLADRLMDGGQAS